MHIMQSRRDFLAGLSAAGAAGVLGGRVSFADEGAPETTTIRRPPLPICEAPQYITEELLRAEGLTDIRYVQPRRVTTPSHAASSTSTSIPDHGSPLTWLPASRSRCWRACIPGASS